MDTLSIAQAPLHWEPHFHLTPGHGWMNDPNALCQFRGTYHFCYQYGPDWPNSDTKWWGHATSPDLLTWTRTEPAMAPELPEERDGVWSGCALVETGPDGTERIRVFYTAHLVPEGAVPHTAYDHVAHQVATHSSDGVRYQDRHVILSPADYPAEVCAHVRDPKVWREADGTWWMLLGTRLVVDESRERDTGAVMLWSSPDGEAWTFNRFVRPMERLGYMWECPNIVRLGGRDYLAVCPQGMPHEELRWQNRWQAGYFPLAGRMQQADTVDAASFTEWDHGFDFYAPQIFVDQQGRSILVGWMGTFDPSYSSAPEGLAWCHCLTLPRELSLATDGSLLQWPVRELDARRGTPIQLAPNVPLTCANMHADILLKDIRGTGALALGTTEEGELLSLAFNGERLSLVFGQTDAAKAAALGRTHRTIACSALTDLRVVVDGSTVEVYANRGAQVFSTRWFPAGNQLVVNSSLTAQGVAYPL
jgi:beta-fructofuranosidase